ncbi:MAG TPA: GMC family oxidoreductase N-terminal domain-containing protein [Gaiellaceae bacterium]|nr:GMC family oxidoreductase N-terminal domain-containing protein [Gaiellaceae bacterium]
MHDVVIVGGGTAGCVLAARLTENPDVSVLLLEAGPRSRKLEIRIPAAFSKLYRTSVDWGDSTTPQEGLDGREVVFPRGRMLGGSAAMNAMMVLRGHRADYDGWASAGCAGWSWADVEPAFARSSAGAFPLADLPDRHVLAEAFVHAAQAAGIRAATDLNGENNEGVGLVPVSQRRGRRFSVLDGYYAPSRRRPNLTVVTDALASRVLLEGGRALGVAYLQNGDEQEVRGRSEVVLCAGAVGSPHLLQLSGIGPPAPLEAAGVEVTHELPAVGANLVDHLANGLLVRTKRVETLASAESIPNLLRWALRGRGPLTSNLGEAVAFVRSRPELPAPDLELLLAPVLFEEEGLKPPSEHGLTLAVVLLTPRSSGTVLLRSSDPRVPPAIDPRYLTDPEGEDAARLLYGLRLARNVLTQEPLASFVDSEILPGADARSDDDLRAHLRALSQTLYHPAGTCRMGSDADAVVDPRLRVRGITGLRVVDASVMPRLPRGHTNWPTVMIAERASELIAADLAGV